MPGRLYGESAEKSREAGLVQFIADLRNARARELEEKRINKELANIRSVPSMPPRPTASVANWC